MAPRKLASLRGGAKDSLAKAWTINVGGLKGLWRLIHLLQSTKLHLRPQIVAMRETSSTVEEWKATLNRLGFLVCMAYASSNLIKGCKTKGSILLVSHQLRSKMLDEVYDNKGLCNCH